jgi:hypothetical protein
MARKYGWLFDGKKRRSENAIYATVNDAHEVIDKLTDLAMELEGESGMRVLDAAPDVYSGPVNSKAAQALLVEACATWLWGQVYSEVPDGRQQLLDIMSN